MEVGSLYCRYDDERKKYCGIAVDALNLISKRTGLRFKYKAIPEEIHPQKYVEKHENAVVAPSMINSLITYTGQSMFF